VGPGDAEQALAVVNAVRRESDAADGADPLDEAGRMALARSGLDGAALWVDGTEGFALLRGHGLDLAVRPDARGGGIGTSLARSALGAAPDDVTAWSHVDHPAARIIAERVGLAVTRELWVMERDTTPVEVPAVEGVTIRGYVPEDADEVLRVNAAAFAHHPEQGSMDAANLAARMGEPWFDPAGLLVADAGPTQHGLLGFHWTKQHSAELGEVYVVAVDPAAQGRGLGRALTAAGLAHLGSLGVRRIILYVESDNAPAIATYARLGFDHTQTHVQYSRSLRGSP
jgi:mycothiol synthase